MDGPEVVGGVLADEVGQRLRAKLVGLRERYGVDPDVDGDLLPDLSLSVPYDKVVLPLDAFPALLVSVDAAPGMRLVDMDPAGEVWQVRYDVRLFLWTRAQAEDRAVLARNRLALGLREVLLERRQLTGTMDVDPTTLSESYNAAAMSEGAWVAGAYLRCVVTTVEALDRPVYGDSADIDVTVTTL